MAEALGTGQAAPVSARTGKAEPRVSARPAATPRGNATGNSSRGRQSRAAGAERRKPKSRRGSLLPTPVWYNPRKVAQMIAYFANRAGGRIAVLKAIKLAYLADRRHMKDYAHPLFHDNIVSMRHGPVHSITYDFINGIREEGTGWGDFVKDRADHELAATKKLTRDDLDEFSKAEMDTLKATWREFGRMDAWQVRDWTHENCPEWEDPGNNSMPLPHERIFKNLGYSDAAILVEEIEEERRADEFWASL